MTDFDGTISDDQITALFTGVSLAGSSPDIVGNRIEGGVTAVSIQGEGSAATFSRNELCGTQRTVAVSDGATEPDLGVLADCTEATAAQEEWRPQGDSNP